MDNSKQHWDKIYTTKSSDQVSWTQEIPSTSIGFVQGFNISKDAAIIDVGGGESRFVDYLLEECFKNITVLDISHAALRKTQARLGERASLVKWIVSDVRKFVSPQRFDVWHDRATFHFLTTKEDIEKYVELAGRSVNPGGFMAIATFSEKGPTQCSGLSIKQYSERELEQALTYYFRKIRCIAEDHLIPFQTTQNFLFCSFRRAA